MNLYSWIMLLHILSASLLFGTGLGIAFFMFRAYLSDNREAMKVTTRNVVLADWIFTTPAIVVQLGTGLWLTWQLGIPFGSAWFIAVLSLFIFVGICWIPVVRIQIHIRQILTQGGDIADYRRLMRAWIALGIPAFTSILILFYLMVSKTGANTIIFG